MLNRQRNAMALTFCFVVKKLFQEFGVFMFSSYFPHATNFFFTVTSSWNRKIVNTQFVILGVRMCGVLKQLLMVIRKNAKRSVTIT